MTRLLGLTRDERHALYELAVTPDPFHPSGQGFLLTHDEARVVFGILRRDTQRIVWEPVPDEGLQWCDYCLASVGADDPKCWACGSPDPTGPAGDLT